MSSFPSFAEFYEAVHSHPPFQWQDRLATQVWQEKAWPEHVSAPTGAGKTSTIDIAVWCLARDVALNGITDRRFPLRIFLTVERRLVVDDAAEHAASISEAIEENPALNSVNTALRQLLPVNHAGPVLQVTSLHGGKAPEYGWLRPHGAQIITATVTQLASRTLFRGVSVSPGTLPMHAGLTGVDRLILIDEPHLAPAAVKMWRESESIQRSYPRSPLVGSTVVLGATVPSYLSGADRFEGSLVGDPSPYAQQRFRITKPAKIEEVINAGAVSKTLVSAAIEAFEGRSHDEGSDGVLIVVNTIATAVKVAKALDKALKKHKERRISLLTSTVRPVDRTTPDSFGPDTIIVATQTVEVGVDIDAEVLITELPAMPALIQRFGRVNRTGQRGQRVSTIVAQTDDLGPSDKAVAFIYGKEQMASTWQALTALAGNSNYLPDANALTVPPEAWEPNPRTCRVEDFLPRLTLTRPPAQAPWEALAFGPDHTERASVTLAWRETLDDVLDKSQVFSEETISIPIAEARLFLAGRRRDPLFADTIAESSTAQTRAQVTVNCRVRREEEWVQPQSIYEIRPDDLIVISTSEGGYSPQEGFSPKLEGPVEDKSMEIAIAQRRGFFDVGLLDVHASKEEEGQDIMLIAEEFGMDPVEAITGRIVEIYPSINPEGIDVILSGRLVSVRDTADGKNRIPARVPLADHSVQTSRQAAESARLIGFDSELIDAMDRAGLLHDAGKTDKEFQHSFHNYLAEPVAKPVGAVTPSRRDRGQIAWRHEILSATAVNGAELTDDLVRHLIVTHHGWGRRLSPHDHITRYNSSRYRALEEQFGPWGLALLETVLRSADWAASRKPQLGLADSWDNLGITISPEALQAVPPVRTDYELKGPTPYSLTMLFAGFGALAACVRDGESNAHLRVANGVVEISSIIPPRWDTDTFNAVYHAMEIGAGRERLDGTPRSKEADDFVAKGNKWYLPHRKNALERSADALPLFFDAEPETGSSRFFSVPIHLRNGNPFAVLPTDDGATRSQALFNPTVGIVEGKLTGGLDTGADDRFAGATARRYSEDQLAWAIAGMMALGIPASALGVGVRDRQLVLPVPSDWVSLDELRDLALAPVSTVEKRAWRSQASRQSEQVKLWEAVTSE